MKKLHIILSNLFIVFLILSFVIYYVHNEILINQEYNTETFTNMTVGMEQVTTNYLISEQRTCDNWAHYINNKKMTMQEAIDYLAIAQTITTNSAHIVSLKDGSFKGLSNRPHSSNPNDFSVSYETFDIFTDYILSNNNSQVNATRSFTNPMNGVQSIAFCNNIDLKSEDGSFYDAVLMRIIPVDSLSDKWVFPTDKYVNAQISMIDSKGNYIIRGKSFKNSNFFEFYKSYNQVNYDKLDEMEHAIITTGQYRMLNSKGEECLIIHVAVKSAPGWYLISYIPMSELSENYIDWLLIGFVTFSLILLLLLDIIFFMLYNKKLTVAAEAARAANKAKTDFLSTMSHDIRTPMNAITGLTMIAEKNISDTKAVKENLVKIRMASNHLLTLINDILDISKVESGRVSLSLHTFSINDTIDNLLNISQPMVREKNIDFHFERKPFEHEYLFADQLRINQIFINILSNAIKYTPEGNRVEIELHEEPSQKPDFIKLIYSVSDTGIGISKEFMENIYTPFARATDSRINSIQGTGLGLAITKRMVDLMEGQIECQSEVGKGTTFTVTLELQISDVKDISRQEEANLELSEMNVLIAEDMDVNWEIIKTLLEMYGIHSERAENGQIAVEKLRDSDKIKYDAVFMDVQMPVMNGLEATREIRKLENPAASQIPIIAMTADAFSENVTECLEAGMNGHISKPIDIKFVIRELKKIQNSRIQNHAEKSERKQK